MENIELNDIGYLLALTGSNSINEYAISKLSKTFGEEGTFRLISTKEMQDPLNNPVNGLFSNTDDYINISEVVRDYPKINEVDITSKEQYIQLIQETKKELKTIPIFIKDNKGEILIIPSNSEQMHVESGNTMIYLGKKLE